MFESKRKKSNNIKSKSKWAYTDLVFAATATFNVYKVAITSPFMFFVFFFFFWPLWETFDSRRLSLATLSQTNKILM